eukprot:gene1344-15744_t
MLFFTKVYAYSQVCNTCFGISTQWVKLKSRQAIVLGKTKVLGNGQPIVATRSYSGKESIIAGPNEFEISPSGQNPAFDYISNTDNKIHRLRMDNVTFKGMGLRSDIIQGLESLKISQPTVIQIKAIPRILEGKNVLCAAQTGSGKTLAYLVPILDVIKRQEENGIMTRFQRPRVCIVAPFRELAVQILTVIKEISHHVPVRSLGCIGGGKDRLMHKGLKERPIDIIVGTPGTVLDLVRKRKIFFTDLNYLVFDEVDTMFDASFKGISNELFDNLSPHINNCGDAKVNFQSKFVFAAATVPKFGVLNKVKAVVKDLEVITSRLHHILPHVKYVFIKALQPDKPSQLIKLLCSRITKEKKSVIFVNSSSTCNWLSKYLEQNSIRHVKLTGKDKPDERHKVFQDLRAGGSEVLLCTDIASRGLDFPDLFYVINYDCPLNPTDFIHRAGRTGRARAEYFGVPEVYTFLSKNWEVMLARKIQSAALSKKEVEDVTVIKRLNGPLDIAK